MLIRARRRAVSRSPSARWGAPQHLTSFGVTTSKPCWERMRAVCRDTSGKTRLIAQPRKKPTRPRFFPRAGIISGISRRSGRLERREDSLHLGQDAGQKPVDPETADRPLEAEALVEPGGQQGGFHQRGRGEHPLQDEVAQHPGGEGRGVEDLRLAPAELHDRSDADARRDRPWCRPCSRGRKRPRPRRRG